MTHAELRIVVAATAAGFLLGLLGLVEWPRLMWRVRQWRKKRARGGYLV